MKKENNSSITVPPINILPHINILGPFGIIFSIKFWLLLLHAHTPPPKPTKLPPHTPATNLCKFLEIK